MSNTTSAPPAVAGIDVGKASLQLAISLPDGKGVDRSFPNTPEGRAKLVALCARHQVKLVVLEATGGLELEIAVDLVDAAIPVSVITPAQSKAFAKAIHQQAKTDAIDGRMLGLFARRINPKPSQIPSETQRNLRELAARRRQLTGQLVQEKNRIQQARDPRVQASLTKAIAFLKEQLDDIDRHLSTLIAADPALQATVERLDSVPSIGTATATALVIHCPELGTLNRQEIASLAGLAPFNRDSGVTHGPRTTRGGRSAIRTTLYMATVCAIRFNPIIKTFYAGLVRRGKKKMVALIAAMRKLLIIMNTMAREKKMWSQFAPKTLDA